MIKRLEGLVEQVCWARLVGVPRFQSHLLRLSHRCITAESFRGLQLSHCPRLVQGKLSPSVLEDVRKATSPDVHHAQGKCRASVCVSQVASCPSVSALRCPIAVASVGAQFAHPDSISVPCVQAWRCLQACSKMCRRRCTAGESMCTRTHPLACQVRAGVPVLELGRLAERVGLRL